MALPSGGYTAKDHESEILKFWLENKFYKPEYNPETDSVLSTDEMKLDGRGTWSLICPPPNAYGRPHIGNLSGYAYMDAMARYQRMNGKKVLMVPGKDHAGLEGEGVFVREVLEKQKRYKFDIKREDFYAEMMDWMQSNMTQALKDEQEIGLSADFDRNTFTLDPNVVDTVLDTFIEMYNKQMIYKGVRIINWDPKARTAVADNQIEYEERTTPFYYFKYSYGEPVKEALDMKKEFEGRDVEFTIDKNLTKSKRNSLINESEKIKDSSSNFVQGTLAFSPGGEVRRGGFTHNHYNKELKAFAQENRKKQTEGEMILWSKLRNKQFMGYKFLRQRAINNYIVDYFQPETSLIIEIDGMSHDDVKFDYDQNRQTALEDLGYKIIRFSEFDVKSRIEEVLQSIENFIEELQATPLNPLSRGENAAGNSYTNVEILGVGFNENKLANGETVKGKVVGIEMRLDNKFRLVVVNPSFEGNLSEEIYKSFADSSKLVAGSHIVLFDEYPEDKYYTNGFIIGTVRPETIFADTAIACDPKDSRYKEFVGKEIEVEFLGEKKKLNFIEDFAVDKDFGTGLLKVTPAHASEDWEIAQRHKEECFPAIQVVGYDLKLNHLTGKYEGQKVNLAREEMIEDMKKHGNLVYLDTEYKNKIKIAERTKAPIEPLLSSQWYLKYDGIKEAAKNMVKDGKVKLHPEAMISKFNHWMDNLRDWAISRSLWWGYRLPVWYHGEVKEEIGEDGQVRELIKVTGKSGQGTAESSELRAESRERNPKPETRNILSEHRTLDTEYWLPLEYNNPNHLRVQKESPGEGWHQDENVLDTWFSSGQWVYATLEKYDLMKEFFPTNVMVSGFDILENWISRMMMFTYFKHNQIPFQNIYLTGLVKGNDGQKMSKSKGNVLNIDDLRDKYGTDAVRMVYFYQNSAGTDYAMTYDKLDTFKKFINKLWNASKFVMMNIDGMDLGSRMLDLEFSLPENKALYDHIIQTKEHITKNIEDYEFGLATYNLYHAFWHEFADVHIEAVKKYTYVQKDKETGEIISEPDPAEKEETQKVLLFAIREYLKMLHPFIPFVTERIWKELPKVKGDHKSLMYTKWDLD